MNPTFRRLVIHARAQANGWDTTQTCGCPQPDRVLVSGSGWHLDLWMCATCRKAVP